MRQRFIQSFSTSGTEHEAIDAERLGKPYVAYIEDGQYIDWNTLWPTPPTPEPVYSAMPLTFEFISGGTFGFNGYGGWFDDVYISASTDNGETWQVWQATTAGTSITVNAGDKIIVKGNNNRLGKSNASAKFTSSGNTRFIVYGNPMSLLNSTGFTEMTSFEADFALARIFYTNEGIISAKNMVLPATNLREGCYYEMFNGAINLLEGPVLTEDPVARYSYEGLFRSCRSIQKVTCLATTIYQNNTLTWLADVPATGTFVKHPNATWPTGNSGIPTGWTVENADI